MEHWNNERMSSKIKGLIHAAVLSKFFLPLLQHSIIPVFRPDLIGGVYAIRIQIS
jgi:uncharacterized membrane protein YraQ (UPF0718 family)